MCLRGWAERQLADITSSCVCEVVSRETSALESMYCVQKSCPSAHQVDGHIPEISGKKCRGRVILPLSLLDLGHLSSPVLGSQSPWKLHQQFPGVQAFSLDWEVHLFSLSLRPLGLGGSTADGLVCNCLAPELHELMPTINLFLSHLSICVPIYCPLSMHH